MSDLIDRQQAIEAICMETCGVSLKTERCMVHCTEVQTIEQLPSAQPEQLGTNLAEVGTDTISRAKAIEALTEYGNGRAVFISIGEAVIRIEQLPPSQPEPSQVAKDIARIVENEQDMMVIAQPERIKGHWIEHDDGLTACECSVCHKKYNLYEEDVFGRNFCPNCGADMRGEQDG